MNAFESVQSVPSPTDLEEQPKTTASTRTRLAFSAMVLCLFFLVGFNFNKAPGNNLKGEDNLALWLYFTTDWDYTKCSFKSDCTSYCSRTNDPSKCVPVGCNWNKVTLSIPNSPYPNSP